MKKIYTTRNSNDSSEEFSRKMRIAQFAKFLVGGGTYFCSGFATFALFYSLIGWDWLPSKIVSDVVGLSLGYLVARYWAFNHKKLRDKNVRTGFRYTVTNISDLAIGYVIVATLSHVGFSPYVGLIVSAIVATSWSYLCSRFWVFNPK